MSGSTSELAVVVGATGAVGSRVVSRLTGRGLRVVAVARGEGIGHTLGHLDLAGPLLAAQRRHRQLEQPRHLGSGRAIVGRGHQGTLSGVADTSPGPVARLWSNRSGRPRFPKDQGS